MRVVHASPDAPAVDDAATDGPVLFGGVPFRGASQYASVEGGSYDLEGGVAGTTTVALPLPGTVLSNGMNYTVFATGLLADGSLWRARGTATALRPCRGRLSRQVPGGWRS